MQSETQLNYWLTLLDSQHGQEALLLSDEGSDELKSSQQKIEALDVAQFAGQNLFIHIDFKTYPHTELELLINKLKRIVDAEKQPAAISLHFDAVPVDQFKGLCEELGKLKSTALYVDVALEDGKTVDDLNKESVNYDMQTLRGQYFLLKKRIAVDKGKPRALLFRTYDFEPTQEILNRFSAKERVLREEIKKSQDATGVTKGTLRPVDKPSDIQYTSKASIINTRLQLGFGALSICSGIAITVLDHQWQDNPFSGVPQELIFVFSAIPAALFSLSLIYEAYEAKNNKDPKKHSQVSIISNLSSVFVIASLLVMMSNAFWTMFAVDALTLDGFKLENRTEKVFTVLYTTLTGALAGYLCTDLYAWKKAEPGQQHSLPARLMA